MAKIQKSIEIVISTEKRLSSMSFDSRQAIRQVLSRHYEDVAISEVNSTMDLELVIARQPDLVFMGMTFAPDNPGQSREMQTNSWLSTRLSQANIMYTGSSRKASQLDRNKNLAKQRVSSHGLATAKFQVITRNQSITPDDITLSYPIFVKPTDGGGGGGINEQSLVHSFEQLQSQVRALHASRLSNTLLEEYLPGREFSVGLLRKPGSNDFHILPLEIIARKNTNGDQFLSSKSKSDNAGKTVTVTDPGIRTAINELALKSFTALGARDYGRIDIRLDASGTPHFLEANLLPSLLVDYGSLPMACAANIGLSHEDLILQITELALSRDPQSSVVERSFSPGNSQQPLQAF